METGRPQDGTKVLRKPPSRLSRQFGAAAETGDSKDRACGRSTVARQTIALKAGGQPEAIVPQWNE
jgi:hypothetical protein